MDNQRLFLFLIFIFSLFMLWSAWEKKGQPVPATVAAAGAKGNAADVPSVGQLATGGLPAAAAGASQAARVTVRTDLMAVEISSQGGDLVGLELLTHRASGDQTQNFKLFDVEHAYAAQSGLIGPGLPNHKTLWRLPVGELNLKDGEQELSVPLVAEGEGGVKVVKTYVFHRGSYLVDVKFSVTNEGATALTPFTYYQLARDDRAPAGSNSRMASTFTGPAFFTDTDKFTKAEFADITKGSAKIPAKANNGWVAMVQHYFFSAWLPAAGVQREFFARKTGENTFAAGMVLPMASIAPGASGETDVQLYAGPQEQDKLKLIAPGLDRVVDYGRLTIIAEPIFWGLETLHRLVGNWGWSIILLTVLIKAVFFPLSAASYKSMAKMRQLAPKLQALKETYADDKQRLNQEMMDLYKREKVNPLGGCLPILIQIPVFIALYWVLLGTVEMRDAPWILWVTDLSTPDAFFGTVPKIDMPVGILPIIMAVSMIVQTKLSPTPPDPMQAKVTMMMPLIFGFMFFWFPSGLVLYWTVNNLLSIAQQWQVNRMIESAGLKGH